MHPPDLSAENAIDALRPQGSELYRIADDGVFRYRVGQRHQIRELFGEYSMLMHRRVKAYNKRALQAPALLALANVRHFASKKAASYLRRYPGRFEKSTTKLLQLRDPAPLAFFRNSVQLLANKEAVLARMSRWQPGDPWPALIDRGDLEHEDPAIVSQLSQLAAHEPAKLVERTARVLSYKRNSLELEVEATQPGVLLINESDFPGWRATVDDRPAPLFRANYRFRALLLDTGEHRIKLVFRPERTLYALYLFFAVLAVLIVWGLWRLIAAR
jgi:hypothetical protein